VLYATCVVALGCSYVCTSVRAYRAQVCEREARRNEIVLRKTRSLEEVNRRPRKRGMYRTH